MDYPTLSGNGHQTQEIGGMNKIYSRMKGLESGWMKRGLLALAASLLVPFVAMAQDSDLVSRYTANRPVTIICDWDKPPYEFMNDKGQPAGSNIDILKSIMEELKIPCRFVMKEWGNAIKTFERGDADLILANVRRYRKAPYIVSDNIINYNRIVVATNSRDSIGIVTQKMLEEGHAVFKPSDYAAKFFIEEDSMRASKIEFQSPKVALTGIVAGDNKYFVWGEAALKWKIKELNLEGITLCDVSIPISEIHVIGRDQQLIEEIDDHYSRMKQRGDIEHIHNQWFHPDRMQDATPPFAIYTIIVILLLITLFYLLNRLSRADVRKNTGNAADLNNMMMKALQMGNIIITEYDIKADRMTNRYGHLLPDDGLSLQEFLEHIDPNERQDFQETIENLINGRDKKSELEKHWRNDSGEQLLLHGNLMAEADENGHPAYIISAVHNVTSDEQNDIKYQELLHMYNSLFNVPLISIALYDKDGWPLDINDSMKTLCGFGNGDNERYWSSLCMFDIPLFRTAYSPTDRDDLIVCQHMEYPEMGIDRYIEFHVHPILNDQGDITNYVCSTVNITDERERVQQVREQEKRIRQTNEQINLYERRMRYLLANSNMYVWQSDEATKTIQFTRTMRKPEFTETFEEYLSRLDIGMRQMTIDLWNDSKERDQMYSMTCRFTRTHNSDQPQWCYSSGFPVYDAEGNVKGHFGIIRDITDLMEAQEKLREETARANDSGHQKSMFLASMTHEIRTPLNSIVGFSDLLKSVEEPEERHEFIRIIRTNCDMLLRLINDILEASSINDGPQSVNPTNVDFAKAFNDICQTLEQRLQSPDVVFLKDNPYDTYPAHLDIGRIQQVITNFFINAVKYTQKGHIRVGYFRTPDSTRPHSFDNPQNGLYIYCEDTGVGIPKDKQKTIFERFVKLNEFVQGTGLGLSICKSIAERCGGNIGVVSEGEGQGSTFWIWIPLNKQPNI